MKIIPSLDELLVLGKTYNLIPIYKEFIADLETPISIFMKLYKDSKYSFLLDSVTGGESRARYSFLGADPAIIFCAKKSKCSLIENGLTKEFSEKNPIGFLKQLIGKYKAFEPPYLPPFYGGAVGYFSYDAVRNLENIPDTNTDDLELPDMSFMFPNHIITFDHVTNKIKIAYNIDITKTTNDKEIQNAYKAGQDKIEELHSKIQQPLVSKKMPKKEKKNIHYTASVTEDEYKKAVNKAKEYITSGDIFQVQISRRLEVVLEDNEHFSIYRALRSINPSPYLFYLRYSSVEVIGSSPELLVKKEKNKVIVRPIAGTRRRGRTLEDEIKMEKELTNDEKERAEHIMLVDLGRNDLGRVCEFGSVKLASDGLNDKLMYPEKYSHVMHLVSEIEGKLSKGNDAFDAFSNAFPAGTLTGAPKIRAMEIIEELEPIKRGLYGGSVAYFSFNGDMDSCIIIRTIVIKDNIAYIQTAGGVVYDSVAELEFLETKNKASAMIKAIEDSQYI